MPLNFLCSKKYQISTQIFIYVIAIIMFSFILLYGYNAIRGFKERSEEITYIKFKTNLISTVKRISPDYGTLKREEFFIGGEYSKVCFVQSYKQEENRPAIITRISDNVVKDSVESRDTSNAFLFKDNSLEPSLEIGKINVSGGYLCIPVINGKVRIEFEGKGDNTLISTW